MYPDDGPATAGIMLLLSGLLVLLAVIQLMR